MVALCLFLLLQDYITYVVNQYDYEFSWYPISLRLVVNYSLWALLAAFIYARALSFLNRNRVGVLFTLSQIGISLMVSAMHRVVALRVFAFIKYLQSDFLGSIFSQNSIASFGAGVFSSFIQYWIFTLIFIAIGYYHKYQDKQLELQNAELRALKMQLHPHFLFNTLHAISSLIDHNAKGAQKMLSKLAFLLRSVLESDGKDTSTLEEEIKFIQSYLEIEQERFQDRLRVDFDIDDEILEAAIPHLLLQPIVENSIKHGVSKLKSGGHIGVSAVLNNGSGNKEKVLITISDNGSDQGGKNTNGTGIGLRNVDKRLQQYYQNDYTLMTSHDEEGYAVQIEIPFLRN